jgi:hypothetical protein
MFTMKANDMFHTPSSEKELIGHIEDIAKASGNPGAVWTVAMMVNNFLASRQVKTVERAKVFATAAHAAVGQTRKYTGEPYQPDV